MHFTQVLIGDVGVNLCCCDIAMAEHALNRTDICTVHE